MARSICLRPSNRNLLVVLGLFLAFLAVSICRGDTVVLKNGLVYRGTVERDNTLYYVSDNLKRVTLFYSKVARIDSDPGSSILERFAMDHRAEPISGTAPIAAVDIHSTPWDKNGRRKFTYVNSFQKRIEMLQAINEFGPLVTKFRGIDGFWFGQVATNQIPRPVILGLLGKVEQTDIDERLKVTRWLIQAEWYAEALQELDRLLKDFPAEPNLKERVGDTRKLITELAARDSLREVATRRHANQPLEVRSRLQAIPTEGLPNDILDDVRGQLRRDGDQNGEDRRLTEALRSIAEKLGDEDRKAWKVRLAEVLEVIARAPDAARPRLEAFEKAGETIPPEARFALAMSGWMVGSDQAVDSLKTAHNFWRARSIIRDYLASRSDLIRETLLDDLSKVEGLDFDKVARIVIRMEPPLRDPDPSQEKTGVRTTHRVVDDGNPIPSEYDLILPPEYHPSRNYPAIVALHDGRGSKAAAEWVASEAARRGYIVIAPEYNVPDAPRGYHYTTGEHAAVQLSIRDARKRYAIDSDRVYLAGQLVGADMAWDVGLAHPDLFAGVASVSGFPGKYAYRYKDQIDTVPLYIVLGELAPVARELIYEKYAKPLIDDLKDVIYVDYLKRGLEELPEEVPSFFDWFDRRRRDPAPKSIKAASARDGDDRFFGVIVREFAPGRITAPEAADPLGRNLTPATIKVATVTNSNLVRVTTSGINRLDVWLSPRLLDPKRKVEIRINDKVVYKDLPAQDFRDMLEDLRIRGDRQQLYYFKYVMGQTPRTKGR